MNIFQIKCKQITELRHWADNNDILHHRMLTRELENAKKWKDHLIVEKIVIIYEKKLNEMEGSYQ